MNDKIYIEQLAKRIAALEGKVSILAERLDRIAPPAENNTCTQCGEIPGLCYCGSVFSWGGGGRA